MTVPSLYASTPFYDSTSALSGNPFATRAVYGVSGTLRGSCLSANPAFGNIGYANRIEGVGESFLEKLFGTVKDIVTPTAANLIDTLVQKGFSAARKASGYTLMEVVQIQKGNQTVFAQKAKKPDGSFVVIFADGSEMPYTSDIAAASRTVNPSTGLTTAQTTGIVLGGVALVALLFFMSKRR